MGEKRAVQPEDLFRLNILQEAHLSPDGRWAVYSVTKVDSEKEVEHSTLWLASVDGKSSRPLTSGNHYDSSPSWSPDGEQIAFLSDRGEKPQIYLIDVNGGEAHPLTKMKEGVGDGPLWSPDGKMIAFSAGPQSDPPDPKKPYRVTRHTYRFDMMGYVDNIIQDIYIIPVLGGEARQLTSDEFNNTPVAWAPDGKEILFAASFRPDAFFPYTDLKITSLEGEMRVLLKDWGAIDTIAWTPDGTQVVFSGWSVEQRMGTRNRLWSIDSKGGEPHSLSENLVGWVNHGIGGDLAARWGGKIFVSKDNLHAFAHVQQGGSMAIYRFSLAGKEEWDCLVKGNRCAALMDANETYLLYGVGTMENPGDLFIADLNGSNERQLTHLNEELIAGWKMPSIERISFPGVHGDPIEGWIMKPVEGKPPFPTILYVHGGPQGAYGYRFSFDFNMLAGAGYAILFTNPRGSTGYSDEFVLQLKKSWGDIDYKDLMAGVDFAIEKGDIDPQRLGIYGLSYGGYMSCWAITQTHRFKAAVAENPVSDLFTEYGVNDIDPWASPDEYGGQPHEAWDVYWNESPIAHAHQCKTPTLLIQGESDYRCPAGQSEEFYTILKANGCLVEMVRLPESSHAGTIIGKPLIRRIGNEVLLDWMDRFVLGKTNSDRKVSC